MSLDETASRETQQILRLKERKQTKHQAFSGTAENCDFVYKTLNKIIRKL